MAHFVKERHEVVFAIKVEKLKTGVVSAERNASHDHRVCLRDLLALLTPAFIFSSVEGVQKGRQHDNTRGGGNMSRHAWVEDSTSACCPDSGPASQELVPSSMLTSCPVLPGTLEYIVQACIFDFSNSSKLSLVINNSPDLQLEVL